MKLNNNQSGIAHLAIIILAVIILAIGFIGWKIWQGKEEKTDSTIKSSTSENKDNNKDIPAKSTQSDKYLVIKEYGVKIKLSNSIDDAYYKIERGYPYLSTKSLNKYPECDKIAAISKTKVGDDNFGDTWSKEELERLGKLKIDEAYIWIEPSNGGSCTDPTGENPDPIEGNARSEFLSAEITKL